MNPDNEYAERALTPKTEAENLESPIPNPPRVHYLQAYGSVFDGPHWGANLFWVTLCHLIPVVGEIVFLGYSFEIIELNSRQPAAPNPPFTFDRFVYYLTRGVWPWLVRFIAQFILQIPIMLLYFAVVIPLIFLMPRLGNPTGPIVFGVGIGLFVIAALTFGICTALVLFPIILRAGLTQDFVPAFKVKWIIDFNRRVGVDVVLVILFMVCTVPVLFYLGYFMCFVGLFPAITIIQLAFTNLLWQLYNLYLARGGEPIPLKPRPNETPPLDSAPLLGVSL